MGQGAEYGRKLLGDNYVEVKYEDLLENTGEEISRLLKFLGADAREKNVRRCVEAASFEKLSGGRKPGEEDANSFFRKGVAGDWKNAFAGRDREIFKEAAGDLLIKLGTAALLRVPLALQAERLLVYQVRRVDDQERSSSTHFRYFSETTRKPLTISSLVLLSSLAVSALICNRGFSSNTLASRSNLYALK